MAAKKCPDNKRKENTDLLLRYVGESLTPGGYCYEMYKNYLRRCLNGRVNDTQIEEIFSDALYNLASGRAYRTYIYQVSPGGLAKNVEVIRWL